MTKFRVTVWIPILAVAALIVLVLAGKVSPNQAGALLTIGTAAVSSTFLIAYSLIGRWWRTEEGRTVVSLVAVIAFTTDYIVTALIWGPYLGRDLVRLTIWAGAFLASVRITALLIHRQRQGRDARREAGRLLNEGRRH